MQATGPLNGEALTEITRALSGRLRAHHVSRAFIDSYAEDAVQKGVVEYLRAQEKGVEVREPRAFVVEAAFRRAIDELRRESRHADGSALDQMLEAGDQATVSAEDEAIRNLDAQRLQEAIDSLPAEERQVLSLHYFDDLGQRRAAEILFMSERTFRRRLRRTQAHLAHLLGAPAPEPGSHRGVEVGLAAWASLGGAKLVVTENAAGRLVRLLEAIQDGPGKIADRLRASGARVAASDAPERFGAIASGPAGKVVGGCAGAVVVCALSGVVGPGVIVGGGSTRAHLHPHDLLPAPRTRGAERPIQVEPRTAHPTGRKQPESNVVVASKPTPKRRPEHKASEESSRKKRAKRHERQPTEAEVTEEQFSGITRVTAEAESENTHPATDGATIEQAAPAPSSSPPSTAPPTSEEHQAEQQFRGPLAR